VSETKKKTPAHAFKPGNTFGKGRPVGSKSNAQVTLERIGQEQAEAVLNKMLENALNGDVQAQKYLLDRFLPSRKGTRIKLDLPEIKTVSDIDKASQYIIQQMGNGTISPEETQQIHTLLTQRKDFILATEIDERLCTLEKEFGKSKRP
jgi:hypothetical protein